MSFLGVLSFSLKQAQGLRGAVPDNADKIGVVDEFEETAKQARKMYSFNPQRYFDVVAAPLAFLGLMCDSYVIVHRRESAIEARDVLINSWAAVQMALIAIEQPKMLKENKESLKVVIEGFDNLEKEWGAPSNEEAMAETVYKLSLERENAAESDKLNIQLRTLRIKVVSSRGSQTSMSWHLGLKATELIVDLRPAPQRERRARLGWPT
ncbi:hypothetical protein K456DRAFT_43750 [Colletotrichum gloeosporioides 23]|nr:hypothetical protein K456DRAFT_43750 [Colletotrichum gloeosporioides 23]